ncbi:laccase [Auriculariales sp. MPI-PUGE-AT-0066]|nr:laccase [Auriculariales sp. MPI-PUGE-AT-0066]
MRTDFFTTLLLAAAPAVALSIVRDGSATPARRVEARQTCTNDDSKLCWDGTYDVDTDYYTSGPRTGRVVEYTLELQNVTLAPDGRSRQVLAYNGQIPAPTITANWGDTIRVTLKNAAQHNGTGIHWHGIRMLNNFKNDGVNGVTECPIAPGDEKVYEFIAEQYGTSWYHSHYSAQYGDGAWGAVVINGPATAEYDIDLGPVTVSDWFALQTAYQKAYAAERGGPPVPDNFLVGGKNVNPSNTTQGERFKLTFTPGKKHLIRLINTSVDTFFRVSLDGHNMTVVQSDFVPVTPYTTSSVGLAIGQRYNVIIEANTDTPSNYWLRTYAEATCGRNTNDGSGTANAYVTYTGATDAVPTTSPNANIPTTCSDEASIVPHVLINIDSSGFSANETVLNVTGPTRVTESGSSVFRWAIGSATPMSIDFTNPTVSMVQSNSVVPAAYNALNIDAGSTATAYWMIQNIGGVAHPIHLHLHDFNVISTGTGTFNAATATLNWVNPPRRDVAMLPANGYLFIAFKTDNPGIALMHCHIAWHVSEGLSLQLIERQSEIDFTAFDSDWQTTCDNFDTWYNSASNVYGPKTDSGLRLRSNF